MSGDKLQAQPQESGIQRNSVSANVYVFPTGRVLKADHCQDQREEQELEELVELEEALHNWF